MSQSSNGPAMTEDVQDVSLIRDTPGAADLPETPQSVQENASAESKESEEPMQQANTATQQQKAPMQQPVVSYQGVDMRCVELPYMTQDGYDHCMIRWRPVDSIACAQGSLPVVVLLWGMATPRGINLMAPNAEVRLMHAKAFDAELLVRRFSVAAFC